MDMDVIFHIHGNPVYAFVLNLWVRHGTDMQTDRQRPSMHYAPTLHHLVYFHAAQQLSCD